jgi:DNA-binding NtrC family response regulator
LRRILVVDDDPQLRDLLVDTLQTIGYEAIGVSDGVEALASLRTLPAELVISDISMPRMDGIELATRVRQNFPGTGILLITGVATEETERRAHRDKLCDGYLAKPFRIDRIEGMIESLLSQGTDTAQKSGGRRVLVVDDDPHFLDALVETVGILGYEAKGANDCESALQALKDGPFAMVLADVSMPEMNGFDLLKTLKRLHPELPVVIMTGHNLSEPATAMIKASADAYLTKPFRQDAVKAVLSRIDPA